MMHFCKARMIFIAVFIFLVFSTAGIAVAGDRELTLEKAIDTALRNNRDVLIAEEKLKQTKGAKQEAFAGFLPKINLMSYASQKNNVDIPDEFKAAMGKDFTAMLANKAYDMQLSLQQPIFTWGKLLNSNENARLNYLLARESYRKSKSELVFNVKKAYFGVMLAKKLVSIAEEMSAVAESHFKVTGSFYKQGKISAYDVSKAKVQMTNAKTGLLTVRNAEHLSLEGLFNIMGREIDENVVLTTEMDYKPVTLDYEGYIKEAITMRPELESLELQEKMLKVLVNLNRASNKPSLVFTGYVDWIQSVDEFNDISANINDWYRTWNTRLVLNYSLFDGFATRAKVLQSKAQLRQVNIGRDQLTSGIKMELRQICFTLKQFQEILAGQKENVEVARENLKIAEERYGKGLVSDIEVRDAQLALNQAGKDYYQALNDYNVSLAALDKALGK